MNESKRIGKNTPVVRFKVVIRYRMRISHEYIQRTYARTHTDTHSESRCECSVRVGERVCEFSRTNIQYGIRLHIGAHARIQKHSLQSLNTAHWACRRISFSCRAVSLALSTVYLHIYLPSSFADSTLTLTLTLSLSLILLCWALWHAHVLC